jgi:nicotinamidase-related amidase
VKEALLIIDYQNYILDYINQKEVLNNIQKLVNLFEQEEQEIIFVKNIVENDDVNEEIQMDIKEYPVF